MSSDCSTRLQRVAPQLRPAGITGDYTSATAADLTSSYNPTGRETPDNIARFSHRGQPVGSAPRNWAASRDAPRDPNVRYGDTSDPSENIDKVLRAGLYADRLSKLADEQREARSRRERLAPVGHGPAATDPVPAPLEGFGKPTARGESAKQTLDAWRGAEPLRPAGAQLDRGYDWEAVGVDPSRARFGGTSAAGETAAHAMQPTHRTVLVPKVTADYRATVKADVGRPLERGFDDPAEWDDDKLSARAYARRHPTDGGADPNATTTPEDAVAVRQLLSSWAEPASAGAMPSEVRLETQRRAQREANERQWRRGGGYAATDATDARGRTIVEAEEMGDEATAPQLVNPCHYVTLGVESKYFAGGRDLDGIRALAHKCDFGLTDAQIDEVFAECSRGGRAGIEQFKNAAIRKGYM